MLNKQAICKVGIYLRLSKDDGDDIESESITNQRKIITDYIVKHNDMEIYDEYIDDGYSGANFNRPNFKRLLKDIEERKINIVITKNLSRLGRDYIGVGTYIEKYFPDHSVRYIAILDNVDNFEESISNDFVPIKSVFNEKYCKEISIAIKKSKRRKMQEGFYTCNIAPFGYRKDPENFGKLIIDEVSSKTVQKIFELKVDGYTIKEIVKYLGENNYATPAEYMNIRGLEHIQNKNIWKKSSVSKILVNQVYLGHCVRGKTQKISYKTKKRTHTKRNDCIIVPNTHQAIISEETFNKIHNTKKYGCMQKKDENEYLLKQFIYCKNCGKKLVFKKRRKDVEIYCRCNSENNRLCSNDCKLKYNDIENKVFEYMISMYKYYFENNENKDKLYQKICNEKIEELEKCNRELLYKLSDLNLKIKALYNQKLIGKIDDNDYKDRYSILSNQRKEVDKKIEKQEKEIENEKLKLNTLKNKKEILQNLEKLERRDFNNINIGKFIYKINVFKNEIEINFSFSEIGNFSV